MTNSFVFDSLPLITAFLAMVAGAIVVKPFAKKLPRLLFLGLFLVISVLGFFAANLVKAWIAGLVLAAGLSPMAAACIALGLPFFLLGVCGSVMIWGPAANGK